jgi:hypothetical protein
MIRAIIGTVAVLAGFVVVETSTGTGAGPTGSCKMMRADPLPSRSEQQAPVRTARCRPSH